MELYQCAHPDWEEVGETEIVGFVADQQTFYTGNTEHGQIVQV